MRKACKPILGPEHRDIRTGVDRTAEEFASTMQYGEVPYTSREDFLKAHADEWELELHAALRDLLEPHRGVLGLGSGEGEHEVRFFLEGYKIAASDVFPDAFNQTVRLFPGFEAFPFDLFHPSEIERVDDVLITGLDFYFDQDAAQTIFKHARAILKPNGRLIFVLRYRDNPFTWWIDSIGIPLYYRLFKNSIRALRGRPGRYLLKFHGYRRTRAEIIELAQNAGFHLGRMQCAGFGAEWMRLDLDSVFPALYQWFRRLDRKLCIMNNASIFEFLT